MIMNEMRYQSCECSLSFLFLEEFRLGIDAFVSAEEA